MSHPQPAWLPDERADASPASAGWTLRRSFEILLRSRRLIAACVGVCLVATLAYNYGTRPLYQVVSVLSLEEAGVSPLRTRGYADSTRLTRAVEVQVQLLKSSELALAAVGDLEPLLLEELGKGPLGDWRQRIADETRYRFGLARPNGTARPDLAKALRSRLTVESETPSNWINLRFTAYDPQAGVLAVNRLIALYLAETDRRTREEAGASREDIERRVAQRQGRVVESLDRLKKLEAGGPGRTAVTRESLGQELARLRDSLNTARQSVLERKAVLDETATLSAEALMAMPGLRGDPALAESSRQIADLQSRIARSSTTMGERHPEIVSLQAELKVALEQREAGLASFREAADREYRIAARQEAEVGAMIQRAEARLTALDQGAVERSFVQTEAAAGQRAVGEIIEQRIRQSDSDVFFKPTVLQGPEVPPTPISPQRSRNFQYALALGLLVGIALALLRADLDETLKTPEDVKANFALPLLGMVPLVPGPTLDLMGPEEGDMVRLFEAYRVLRTNLVLSPGGEVAHPLIVITSSRPGEGKTTTATGLAVSLARSGMRVLLVDGDLRRASLSGRFHARDRPGLTDAISDRARIREWIGTAKGVHGLHLLPCGTPRSNPAELLNQETFLSAIGSVREDYEVIVCDAPPVLAVADAAILARLADQVLLVIGANTTPTTSVRASLDQLEKVGANVRGLVLNNVDLGRDSQYYKYYYAAQYEDYSGGVRRKGGGTSGVKESPEG